MNQNVNMSSLVDARHNEAGECAHDWRLIGSDITSPERAPGSRSMRWHVTRTFYCTACRKVITDAEEAWTYAR